MNARLSGLEQPRQLHSLSTARILCVALASLLLALALFLTPAQPALAQSGGIDCTAEVMYPGTLPGSAMGANYSQTFSVVPKWTCCYTYPWVYKLYSGSMPTGLTLSSSGVLSGITVRPDYYEFIVRVEDSGHKPNGYWCQGLYKVTVTGTNHAPTFTAGGNVTLDEDAPAYSAAWASNMSTGGAEDLGQTLTSFNLSNDNNALFSVQPVISVADGKLSFTLKPDANGVANVTVTLKDNGGTYNGGADTSAPVTFKITVNPLEDKQPGPGYMVNSTAWTTDGLCGEMNCTMREAIDAANADGAASTIDVVPGVYTLQGSLTNDVKLPPTGLPLITTPMTINGHGAIFEPSAAVSTQIRMMGVISTTTLTMNEIEARNFKPATGNGGALYADGGLVLKNSMFHDNSGRYGGAIYKGYGNAYVYNCTFYNNHASDYGGGISNFGNGLSILSSTFYGNTAPVPAPGELIPGGAAYWTSGAPSVVKNNLLVGNTPGTTCGWVQALASNGNMSDDSTCGAMTRTADQIKLGPVGANGGPTPTMALLDGSAAIDVGNAAACNDAGIGARDQRGYYRVADGNGDGTAVCDVGAYEFKSSPPPTGETPDIDPPVVVINLTPASPDGNNGWYKSAVKVDPQATDASPFTLRCMLDPATVPASFDDLPDAPCPRPDGGVVTTDGEHKVYAAAKDSAGNTSQVVLAAFKIDATGPVITCAAGGPFLLGSGSHTVGPAGVDASISRLDVAKSTLSGTVLTDTLGPKTVIVKAVDLAGNETVEGCAYMVSGLTFDRFHAPVKSPPALNRTKAGSAIPIKFSLGWDAGLQIFAPGYPASQESSCKGEAMGALEPAANPGKSGLSYDEESGQYIFVWKTEKKWAGECRVLTLKFVDGTEAKAYFQFK